MKNGFVATLLGRSFGHLTGIAEEQKSSVILGLCCRYFAVQVAVDVASTGQPLGAAQSTGVGPGVGAGTAAC